MDYYEMVEKLAEEILEKEAALNLGAAAKKVTQGVSNFGKTISGANVKRTQGMLDNLVQGAYKANPNMSMGQLKARGDRINALHNAAVGARKDALGSLAAGGTALAIGSGTANKLKKRNSNNEEKVASEYFEEAQMLKQAASEAYLEAEAMEKAALETLIEMGYEFE